MQKANYRTLPTVEHSIRAAMAEMEAAGDEKAAAQAYARLHRNLGEYIRRCGEMRDEFYKLRATVTKQAHTIADAELMAAVGEAAPSEADRHEPTTISQPDVVAIEAAPDFFFIPLSYGLINIRHIVELDLKSMTLFTSAGTRNLQPEDVQILAHHLKLYRPR